MKNPGGSAEVFIKAYRSFLKSGGEIVINQYIPLYQKMLSSLHPKAAGDEVDFPAFTYAFLRLPAVIFKIKKFFLAQTDEVFHRENLKVEFWEEVTASARRRKMVFDGKDTLGVFINSVTDVDDLICLLTAFQIEWNKLKVNIQNSKIKITHQNLSLFKKN